MKFQPFGYRFEVGSSDQPDQVRDKLRSGLRRWFDPNNGPRGWFVGPVFCLWQSALDRQGPMVIGRVRCDGFGTKITGRAGSDLNGIALFVVLSVLLIFLLYKMIEVGQATTGAILMILGVTIIGLPLTLWINHKDRRQADPLVRYIERAVGAKGSTSAVRQLVDQWTLSLSGKQIEGQPTPTKIAQALESLSSGDFVILAKEDEWYIQARMAEGGWSWKSGRGAQVTIIERQPVADFSARFSLKRP